MERKYDAESHARDGSGAIARRSDDARRVFPVDRYPLEERLLPRGAFRDYRILKVPLLGQRGYRQPNGKDVSNWCGRTTASTIHNWFQLVRGSPDKYISHWNAGDPSLLMDLRDGSQRRVFYENTESSTSNAPLGSYGCFAEQWKSLLGQSYGETALLGSKTAPDRVKASRATEAEIEGYLAPVVESIRKNYPVFLYSGFTVSKNHLIGLVGYAHVIDPSDGQARLWIAVADPATPAGWLPKGSVLDLATPGTKATFADLKAGHDVVLLVAGDWTWRRATLCLVRASFFFRRKADHPAFASRTDDAFKAFRETGALFLEDIGNTNRAGGNVYVSTEKAPLDVPEGAVVSSDVRCVHPFSLDGTGGAPIPTFRLLEEDAERGGQYPVGAFGSLHGGVHLSTRHTGEGKAGVVPVRAWAPGRIVAARLHGRVEEGKGSADERGALAEELSGNTPNFVLVRHELESTTAKKGVPPKRWVFHALYMHLAEPGWASFKDSPYADTPWLAALHRERNGALVFVDPEGACDLAGRPATLSPGAHLWPHDQPNADEISTGSLTVVDAKRYETQELRLRGDDRTRLVRKPAEWDLARTLEEAAKGALLSFAQPHPNLFVTGGTNVGWTPKAVRSGPGFLHWELLSPPGDQGLAGLLREAASALPAEKLPRFFEETTADNRLEQDEIKKLVGGLPEVDRHSSLPLNALTALSFAGPVEGRAPKPGHYWLRLDLKGFPGSEALGGRTLSLEFSGAGKEAVTASATLGTDEAHVVVEAPGWASEVRVTSPGLMVRARGGAPQAKDVDEHLLRVTAHRHRNLVLERMNGWDDELSVRAALGRFQKDDRLEALVRAVCFWGDPDTPVYTERRASTADLAKTDRLVNVHPVLATWLVDLLLERGLVRFVSPEAPPGASAKLGFVGWLPAARTRAPLPAGAVVRAIAVTKGWRNTQVEARLEAVDGELRVVLGEGRYQEGNLSVTGSLSAWGSFELAVHHREGGGDFSAQSAPILGAPRLELVRPELAKVQANPRERAPGSFSWEVTFSDGRPARLDGYLLAKARIGEADFELHRFVQPVVALPAPSAFEWEAGFLVGARDKDDSSFGASWSELQRAAAQGERVRASRELLDALSRGRVELAKRLPGSNVKLIPKSLRGGVAVDVAATANVKKESHSGKANQVLLEVLRGLPGVTATPTPESLPERVTLSVTHDDTPGGSLMVELDARALLGAVLAKAKPKKDEVVDVRFVLRFFNGGHVLPMRGSRDSPPDGVEEGHGATSGVVEEVGASDLERAHLPDLESAEVNARLAVPRIERVRYAATPQGLALEATLVGGNPSFWAAAKPSFVLDGAEPKLGTVVGTSMRAVFKPEEVGADGVGAIQAKTTATATFAGADLAAGAVPVTFEAPEYQTVDALEIADLRVEKAPSGAWEVHAKVEGPRLPVSLLVRPEKGKEVEIATGLQPGTDGAVTAVIPLKKLGAAAKVTATHTVLARLAWGPKVKVESTCAWAFDPERVPGGGGH